MKISSITLFIILTLKISQLSYGQPVKVDSLLATLAKPLTDEKRITVLNDLSAYYIGISLHEAKEFALEALQLATKTGEKKGLAESLKLIGLIHYFKSEYNVAVEYSYQALQVYEELNDKAGQAKIFNNLSLMLNAQRDYSKAYGFALLSLELKRKLGDSLGVAYSFLSLAEYHTSAKQYEDAMRLSIDALSRFKSLDDETGASLANVQVADIYHRQKNYFLALSNYKLALKIAQRSNNHFQTISIFKKLGRLFLDIKELDSARTYLKKTLRFAKEKGFRSQEMEANQFIADYFSVLKSFDSALYYTRKAIALEREIFSNQKAEHILALQVLYDVGKKEQELGFEKQIVKRQFVAIVGVSLILLLAILIGFKFYKLNKTNLQAKDELLKLNLEINKMNEDLERKIQERTEEIKVQNAKLIEYAFFTAHEVRGPLARILGLVDLVKMTELQSERSEILIRLEAAAHELDEIIRTINRKLENEKRL